MSYVLAAGDRWAIFTRRACPRCGSIRTARAHRRTLQDEALAAVRVFPYRCGHCSVRFRAIALLRTLGERPWSADPRPAVIPKRWATRSLDLPTGLSCLAFILLLGAVAALMLRALSSFAR